MGQCESAIKRADISTSMEFLEDTDKVTLHSYELDEISPKSIVSRKDLERSERESGEFSFYGKMSTFFPGETEFYKLSTKLSLTTRSSLKSVRVYLLHDWGDGMERELYEKLSLQSHFPKELTNGKVTASESFSFDMLEPSEKPLQLVYHTHVPTTSDKWTIYFFMIESDAKILVKAKVDISFGPKEAKKELDMFAMSLYEREGRQKHFDMMTRGVLPKGAPKVLTKLGRVAAVEKRPSSAGIFDLKEVRKIYEDFQNIPRPNLQFLLANDGTYLAFRIYEPSSGKTDAVIVSITQNNIFQDVLAYKVSQTANIKVYVAELRGFGYSGGARGHTKKKEDIWKDVRSFTRNATFNNPGQAVFLLGHFYNGGLMLNYDSWEDHLPVDGYILLAPNFGVEARDTWNNDGFNTIIKRKAVKPYLRNIKIAHLTRGLFRGNKPALRYHFHEEVYAANPMCVDTITANAFLSFYPQHPKKLLKRLSRPTYILVGERDNFLLPDILRTYADLVTTESSDFKCIPGSCNNITIISEAVPYITAWVDRILYSMTVTSENYVARPSLPSAPSHPHQAFSLDMLAIKMLPDPSDAQTMFMELKSATDAVDVPYQYLEASDGARLAFQCFRPPGTIKAILIVWIGYHQGAFLSDLATSENIAIYRFDLRGTGHSDLGHPSAKSLLVDIKYSVTVCKKNAPGSVVFLGGQGLTASLVLNYALWPDAEPANAYIFVSPFALPSPANDPLLLSDSQKAFGFRIERQMLDQSANVFFTGNLHHPFTRFFLTTVLSRDLLGQLLALDTPFSLYFNAHNSFIKAERVIDSVCSLASAPMHSSIVLERASWYGPLTELRPNLASWIDRVSASLNPQPNAALFTDVGPADFEKIELVGKGTFGRVWLVMHRSSEKYLAMKIMRKADVIRTGLVEQVIRERDILRSTNNCFVVPFAGSFQDSCFIYILMEFLVGGELYTLLRINTKLSTDSVRFYAAEILMALTALHDRGVAYRDLKPENILLDALGHIRLIDFGLSRLLAVGETCSTFCGSPFYMAPEMISSKNYGISVDLWAFGVVLFELLTGNLPFSGRTPTEIYRKIVFGKINWPPSLDPDARDLITQILQREPSKRLGAYMLDSKGRTIQGTPYSIEPGDNPGATLHVHVTTRERQTAMSRRYNAIMRHRFFKGIDWDLIRSRAVAPPFQPAVGSEGDTSNFIKFSLSNSLDLTEPLDTPKSDPFANF